MPYVSGFDRDQLMCCSWDTFVDKESIARIIDAFVNHLDIKKYGVKAVSEQGRPSYNPIRLTSIMASQAENESRSDNIRRGLTMRAATGASRLYKRKAYGYKQSEKGEIVRNVRLEAWRSDFLAEVK